MSSTSTSVIELATRSASHLPSFSSSEIDLSTLRPCTADRLEGLGDKHKDQNDDGNCLSPTISSTNVDSYATSLNRTRTSSPTRTSDGSEQQDQNVSSLAPVDGGVRAWSFLAGSFIIETFVWGLPNSFGVFLNSYMQDPGFSSQPHAQTILPLVGTLSSGIMYCSGLVLYPILARYPRWRKWTMWIGVFLCWLGLFLASFATKISHLLLFQGIAFGIGGCKSIHVRFVRYATLKYSSALLYAPVMSFLMEWFVRRRGLASGIINAGTAVGGLTLPPILPKLIENIGRAKALRYLSCVFVLIACVLPVMRPRLPERAIHGPRPGTARPNFQGRGNDESSGERAPQPRPTWFKNVPFQLSIIASTVQALAYFVPVLYLPSFASSLGLNTSDASLTVALLNGGSLLSRIAIGLLSDRLNPFALAMVCAFGTSLVTFVLWGVVAVRVASHFSGLLAFGLAYGALAGGWTSLLVGFVRPVSSDDPRLATSLIGLLCAVQGVGNILSTPIATSLFQSVSKSSSTYHVLVTSLQAGGYEKMIIYVGSCFAGAGVLAGIGLLAEHSQSRREVQRPW
ncbi:MFS general substrate transporter [Schizopora paradoxa]|uniref:MFS general substrate transporter n=1 Tax=Schizopora paradoxa TaxID=27342 RepID=A0A0H2RVD6_9AGAM|nr:MFS general substrate transporter [Schizopora paradoxa]